MTLRRRHQLGAATRVGPAFPTKREAATEGASPARHDGRGARATRRCSRHNSHCNSRDPRGATVYTNAPKRRREAISTDLCTLLCPHGRSCDRGAGRFLEQRALPLGGERVVVERSGPSGSVIGTLGAEWQCHPHEAARLGPSGSAAYTAKWHRTYRSGMLGVEWQCDRYAQGRVAV